MPDTKVLITGGAGNVGGSLVRRLVAEPRMFVVVVDNLSTGRMHKLPAERAENWQFIKADVNDGAAISSIMTRFGFDYVFHYAAIVGVQRTLANPISVLGDIQGIRNILELCKNTGCKRVFFSSSSEVYGEPMEIPQREDTTPLNSRLPYAIVKNVGEAFVRSYYQEHGLPYTIFRFFNTYGPDQSDDFVIPRFVSRALSGADLTIYGDGRQTRTFCYIDDNIDATVNVFKQDLFLNDTVNIGSEVEHQICAVAELVIRMTNSRSRIVHLPALAEGDMQRRCPDIRKMRKALDRDLTPLEQGVQRVINHLKGTTSR
jgi:UDP-glucose 4-epimerase